VHLGRVRWQSYSPLGSRLGRVWGSNRVLINSLAFFFPPRLEIGEGGCLTLCAFPVLVSRSPLTPGLLEKKLFFSSRNSVCAKQACSLVLPSADHRSMVFFLIEVGTSVGFRWLDMGPVAGDRFFLTWRMRVWTFWFAFPQKVSCGPRRSHIFSPGGGGCFNSFSFLSSGLGGLCG